MLPFRSILCPVDFSVHSRHALHYGAAMAARFESRVTVLSVSDPLLAAAARAAVPRRQSVVDQGKAELSRFVERSLRGFPSRAEPVTLAFAEGRPAIEILRAAKRLRSDLIVMGTEGLSGVRRFFFGSTTAEVLQRSTVPVLTVPRLAAHRLSTNRLSVSRVVVPLDLSGNWQSEAIRAAAIARALDVELLLVHVVRPLQAPAWLRVGRHTDRERTNRARQALERVARRLSRDGRTVSRVVLGDPATEIARLTRRGTPLVVMPLRGHAGLWGGRGSIAYHVVTQSSAPVLALTQ